MVASCCILGPLDGYVPIQGVQDSKKLTPELRREIYDSIMSQPELYACRIALRSHEEVDKMNVQKATMSAFAESIDLLVTEQLQSGSVGSIRSQAETHMLSSLPSSSITNGITSGSAITSGSGRNTDSASLGGVDVDSDCVGNVSEPAPLLLAPYSIVDGKQSPKLQLTKTPCRPWIKADAQVYTVALASILAKVTHDAYMHNAHSIYPQYGFDVNVGHASADHVLAIHTHGPSPIHRKSVRTMRGR